MVYEVNKRAKNIINKTLFQIVIKVFFYRIYYLNNILGLTTAVQITIIYIR